MPPRRRFEGAQGGQWGHRIMHEISLNYQMRAISFVNWHFMVDLRGLNHLLKYSGPQQRETDHGLSRKSRDIRRRHANPPDTSLEANASRRLRNLWRGVIDAVMTAQPKMRNARSTAWSRAVVRQFDRQS